MEQKPAMSSSAAVALMAEPPAGERTLVDTPELLESAVQALAGAGALAIDVEAGKPRGAAETRAALVQVAAPGHTWLVDPLRLGDRLQPLQVALQRASIPVALFDAPGDVRWLEAIGLRLTAVTDLLQVTRSAYGDRDKGLREALRRHFRVGIDKAGQQADWLARPISGPLRHYAARDAELTLALAERYHDLFPELMAIHTYAGGRPMVPDNLPTWLVRVLSGAREPAYVLAEEDGLPIDRPESIAPLVEGATSTLDRLEVPWQRARVYRAVAGLDLIELAPRLAAALSSPCAVERAAAARALGELRAAEEANALAAARNDHVADVAQAARRAYALVMSDECLD